MELALIISIGVSIVIGILGIGISK